MVPEDDEADCTNKRMAFFNIEGRTRFARAWR